MLRNVQGGIVMEQKSDDRQRQQDDFWDISSLMPKSRQRQTGMRAPGATDAVEIEVDTPAVQQDNAIPADDSPLNNTIPHQTCVQAAVAPVDDYCPEHPLIHRVRVYNIPCEYNYYEQFLRHAERVCALRGNPCQPVPFFSYVPEYSQLTKPQLDWYLWWREQVWHGEYPAVDYSYIMLYVNEIINTGGHTNPEWGQKQLCEIWSAYHKIYPRLNWLMAEWICDFSLIWHLPAPCMPHEFVSSGIMKEFYMVGDNDGKSSISGLDLITYCSNYNYKSSKFASGDAKELYDKHIPAALDEAVKPFYSPDGKLELGTRMSDCHRTRVAYTGALCTYKCRKKLVVDYYCFSHTYEMRMIVTDIIKYAENRLRAYIGIKSRLGVKRLLPGMKESIDAYFDRELPLRKRSVTQPLPDYERLYDVPKTKISAEAAERIERESWLTTERLLEAFGGTEDDGDISSLTAPNNDCHKTVYGISAEEIPEQATEATPDKTVETSVAQLAVSSFGAEGYSVSSPQVDSAGGLKAALGEYMEFVRFVDSSNTAAQHEFARHHGEMEDLIFDKINEIAVDYFGDVILYESDNGPAVVDEYRKELFYD